MTFTKNEAYARETADIYGEHLFTFQSDTGQVNAELFRQDDSVVAYVSFRDGVSIQTVTDRYLAPCAKKRLRWDTRENSRSSILGSDFMPRIIAFCVPDSVRHSLIPGVYGDPFQDGVRIEQTAATQLRVSRVFDVPETLAENEAERIRGAQARRLLRDLNRLIRWFRVLGQQPGLVELSLGKVGGVSFAIESTRQPWGRIEATDERVSSAVSLAAVAEDAQTFYSGGSEPPVEDLFLLDAQEALREGRFREAILFCWSVIDATFNNVFGKLVDAKLPNEWGESRAYMKSIDFPLRKK